MKNVYGIDQSLLLTRNTAHKVDILRSLLGYFEWVAYFYARMNDMPWLLSVQRAVWEEKMWVVGNGASRARGSLRVV